MTPEQFSREVEYLMEALHPPGRDLPDWEGWLSFLRCSTGASGAGVNLCLAESDTELVTFSSGEERGIPLEKRWYSGKYRVELVLLFRTRSGPGEAREYIDDFSEYFSQAITLAISFYEHTAMENLLRLVADHLNVGVLSFDQSLNAIPENSLANGLMISEGEEGWLSETIHKIDNLEADLSVHYRHRGSSQSVDFMLIRDSGPESSDDRKPYRLFMNPVLFRPYPEWLKDIFGLSQSQSLVASYACIGMTAADVAAVTGLSRHTVYSYMKALYARLGIQRQAQLSAIVWKEMPV